MAVKYYKTDLGLFPVIVDDAFYSAIRSFGSGDIQLHNANGLTAKGRTFLSIFPGVVAVLLKPFTNRMDIVNAYNALADLGFTLNLKEHIVSRDTYYNLTGYSNKRVLVENDGDNCLAIGTQTMRDYGTALPFARMIWYDTDYVLNVIYVGVLFANSAMTQFGWISLTANPNKTVRLNINTNFYSGTNTFMVTYFTGVEPIIPPWEDTDPYKEIEPSGPSTPSGTYDFTTSDKINVPALPSLSAVSTGFVSLWSPTEAQMLQLSSFMWNANPLTIEFWKKIVADPMQLIYGLNIVPLDLDALGMIDSTGEVVVGLISTGVSMNHLSGQWVELDCGTVTLDETWSAYLDYDPYTKLEIYLPYCGTHPLRVDDFMPGTVKLKYHIDLLSGACVAILTATKSNKHGDTLDSVVYQFMGNCAAQIPVTASQYADAVRSVIQLAASIGTMIAGAAGAGAAVAAETSALPASAGLAISSGAHQASAMVENVMGIKPNVERSGAIGATGGLLSVQTPYLILTRPRQARPKDQNTYTGYPSFITETLGDLEGWTQIQAIHLEAIPCTADELSEIDELLKSGVIF